MEAIEFKGIPASVQPPHVTGATLSVRQAENGSLSLVLEFGSNTSSLVEASQSYDITADDSTVHLTVMRARARSLNGAVELIASEVNVSSPLHPNSSPLSMDFFLTDLSNPDGYGFPKVQCDFSLNKFSWSLVPKPNGAVWGTLSVTGLTLADIEDAKADSERVVWLLAFANGARLSVPTITRIEIRNNAGQLTGATLRNTADTAANTNAWPIIPLRIPKEVNKYLEWCYPRLVVNDDLYVLSRVMHWLILATRKGQPLHLPALIAAEVLEILRFNFAKNVFNAPQSGDQFEWPPGCPDAGKRMTFGQILRGLVWAVDSSQWKDDFVTFRNSIVHEGEIIGSSFPDKMSNTYDAIHFCQTIVLALLEWDKCHGLYCPYNVRPSKPIPFKR
jgi:hypothetical protein